MRSDKAIIDARTPEKLVVQADPDKIGQALRTLLTTAINHSPHGVSIHLEVEEEQREDGPWAVLAVRDEGPGMALSGAPSLFTRFTPGPTPSGLGLGLYLAQSIASAHGGTLTVESSDGAGSRFVLSLPKKGGHAKSDTERVDEDGAG
jgi:signal transduction histidine kinase